MPRHPDFEKIYMAFMWRYCEDHNECDIGKAYYYGWLNKLGLDDTKAYQRPQEKFQWAKKTIQLLKEDETSKYYKAEVLFPLSSMNDNLYTRDDLTKNARSLAAASRVGSVIDLNHDEIIDGMTVPSSDVEDDVLEVILKVPKDLLYTGSRYPQYQQKKFVDLIDTEEIMQVSITGECTLLDEIAGSPQTTLQVGYPCPGLVVYRLALLTKDVLPGFPLTRIIPVEKLVESFHGIENMPGKNSEVKTETQTETQSTQGTQEAEWDTAYINDLPDSSFAVVEPAYPEKTQDKRHRHLPFKGKDGKVDLPHLRNALARMNQIEPVTDSISIANLRARAQKVLIAAAKDAGVGDYELYAFVKIQDIETEMHALEQVVLQRFEDLKKPKEEPKKEPEKGPCKCVLTKEGFWARFHQLRSEGCDQKDAFRLVALEVLEAAKKKSQ